MSSGSGKVTLLNVIINNLKHRIYEHHLRCHTKPAQREQVIKTSARVVGEVTVSIIVINIRHR